VPASQLLAAYRAAQARLGVPWEYLAAIHLVETRAGRIRGTGAAGARGPMQFLPSTWKRYGHGGDIQASGDAILAAARLLRANGAPADMAGALYSHTPPPLCAGGQRPRRPAPRQPAGVPGLLPLAGRLRRHPPARGLPNPPGHS